jgi:aryl-alcohol dehydrogenase-like predicted oxidoreductase
MSENPPSPERRKFLKTIGLAGASLVYAPSAFSEEEGVTVPRRKFGRHDITISCIGLGGSALRDANDEEAQKIVDGAIERGIDLFDNAWHYYDGKAEELMGRCIKGKRDKVFLMTKVCTHDTGGKKEAMQMLEESLARLQTDHLDLWQVHALANQEQVKRAFAPGGVIEALDEARKQGKVRYVGFTGHTDPHVHLAMLSHGYAFDSCQFPVSPVEANSDAFVRRVLPEVVKQKIAPLAMKTLCGNANPIKDGLYSVKEGLTYALSQPICSIVSGITNAQQLRDNAAIVAAFSPMSSTAMTDLEKHCLAATEANKYQPYRKWMSYRDGVSSHYAGHV